MKDYWIRMSTYKTERILESEYLNRNAYKTELMNDYSIRMSAYKTEKILESEYLIIREIIITKH